MIHGNQTDEEGSIRSGSAWLGSQKDCLRPLQRHQGAFFIAAKAVGTRAFFALATLCGSINLAGAEQGIASIYGNGDGYEWRKTANGETMNPRNMTAAHRTLPFGTRAQVQHRRTGKTIIVRIIDRGPFIAGRIIDLTPAAARALGCDGLCNVKLTAP